MICEKLFFWKVAEDTPKKITPLHGKIIAENAPKNVVYFVLKHMNIYLAYRGFTELGSSWWEGGKSAK